MNKAQETLLQIMSNSLFGTGYDVQIDDSVIKEAKKQAVLLYVTQSGNAAKSVMINSIRIYSAHAELHEILGDIPHTFIKGYTSAMYYDNPMLRQAGDVDFLVKEADLDRISKVLIDNDFIKIDGDEDDNHHISFKKNGIKYEMHFNVNGLPEGEVGKIAQELLSDAIETSKVVDTPVGRMALVDEFHTGLICLLHIAGHLIASGIGLRHICDWAMFVNSIDDFEGVFKERFTNVGIWTFACQLSAACVKYLGLPKQDWMGDWSDEFLQDTIELILNFGNFGNKVTDNRESWMTANVYGGGSYSNNKIIQLFHNINIITKLHWKSANKYKILLPIGFVFFSMRYIVRMLVGKRDKINVKKMVSNSNERKKLFKEFKLFVI